MKYVNTYDVSLGSGQEIVNAVEFMNLPVCSKMKAVLCALYKP
jgi:hypothetical protein